MSGLQALLMVEVLRHKQQMRVLVCGSRGWTDKDRIRAVLEELAPSCACVIDGAARGADQLGHEVAVELGLETMRFPAQWKLLGKRAGHIRNQQMLDEGKPDIVIAFWDGLSRGTMDMIERCTKAGVPSKVYRSGTAEHE